MAVIKKRIFTISLLLILLAAGILCGYAISKYKGSAAPAQNVNEPRSSLQGERNRPSDMPQQTPGARSQLSDNANQTPGGQAADPAQRQRNRQQPDMTNQPGGQFPGQDAAQPAPSGGRGFGGISSAATKYAPQLLGCAAVFLILFIAAYFLLLRKKLKIDPGHEKILLLTLLGVGLLMRLAAATLMDGHNDINIFKGWASSAANNFPQFYSGARTSDYPPLYIYILYLIGKIAAIPAVNSYYTILLKLPSIAADIASSYLIYRLARKYLTLETSVLLAAFYVFNPAVFINSTFWGQVDSFFTMIIMAAVYLLSEKKIGLSAVLFTAAVLMKPQGIIFLPVLFFELVRGKSYKSFLKAAAAALSTAAIIILPFSYNKGVLWIYNLFSKTTGEYPYASVNAFNLYGLLGLNYVKDATAQFLFSYHSWGMIFIMLITLLAWFIYIKGNSRVFASAAGLLLITGVFNLSTRMHERYLFPAVALSILAFIYLKDKRLLLLSAGFSATVYLNTHFVLFKTGMNAVPYSPVLIITSLLNVLLLFYLGKILFDIAVRKKTLPLNELKEKPMSPIT
jgi:Gpi18-like mannosyltransferase